MREGGGAFRSRQGVSSWARRSSYTPPPPWQIDGYPTCSGVLSIDRSPLTDSIYGIAAHCTVRPRCVQEPAAPGAAFRPGGHALSDQLRRSGHRSVSVVLMLVSTFSPPRFNDSAVDVRVIKQLVRNSLSYRASSCPPRGIYNSNVPPFFGKVFPPRSGRKRRSIAGRFDKRARSNTAASLETCRIEIGVENTIRERVSHKSLIYVNSGAKYANSKK